MVAFGVFQDAYDRPLLGASGLSAAGVRIGGKDGDRWWICDGLLLSHTTDLADAWCAAIGDRDKDARYHALRIEHLA
jgi:hypothetical protein